MKDGTKIQASSSVDSGDVQIEPSVNGLGGVSAS